MGKICNALDKPDYLLSQAQIFVEQLQTNTSNLHEERERIEKDLERINADRQWIVTLARKGTNTQSDMEQQLGTLALQEISHKRDLSSLGQTINISSLDNWQAKFEEYLADLRAGVDELKMPLLKLRRSDIICSYSKKQVVDTLVERVTIGKD